MNGAPAGTEFADIDDFVLASMRESGIPGVSVALVQGDQIVHLRGFGVADPKGRPVSAQTPFRIGSNTKSFTALAIMQLAEQGRLDVDAPVQRYLPWFRLADPDAAARITVSQLMYMTSGLPETALFERSLQPDLTLEQYGRGLASVRPSRPAGSSFEYANGGYNVLGLVVEAVSGEPYAAYLQRHIFGPLEMTRTSATLAGEQRNGLGPGYQWWFGFGPFAADDTFSQANLPAGYIASTAEDMAHYQIAQLNGGRYGSAQILSAAGMARMQGAGPNTTMAMVGDQPLGYGMGWATATIDGRHLLFYDGEPFRFISNQTIDLQSGKGVVVLTNATNQLPSGDEPFHSLVNGVVARYAPEALISPPNRPSLHQAYAVLDAILLLVSAWIVWGFAGLARWRVGTGRFRLMLAAVRAVLEVGISLAVLVLMPLWLGVGWRALISLENDLGWWTLVAASLLLLTGLVRSGLLVRAMWRSPRQPEAAAAAL